MASGGRRAPRPALRHAAAGPARRQPRRRGEHTTRAGLRWPRTNSSISSCRSPPRHLRVLRPSLQSPAPMSKVTPRLYRGSEGGGGARHRRPAAEQRQPHAALVPRACRADPPGQGLCRARAVRYTWADTYAAGAASPPPSHAGPSDTEARCGLHPFPFLFSVCGFLHWCSDSAIFYMPYPTLSTSLM